MSDSKIAIMNKIIIAVIAFLLSGKILLAQWDSLGYSTLNHQFTSPMIGYYFYNESGGSPSNPYGTGYLLKSIDGWNTWTQIYQIGSGDNPNVGFIDAIMFLNDTVGYMAAYYNGIGGLSQTSNGGLSWGTFIGGNEPPIHFSFLRADYGYAKIWGPPGYGLYLYDDGQKTLQNDSFVNSIYSIRTLMFINDSTGFLVPAWNNPPVYRTSDYGKTWQLTGDSSWACSKVVFPEDKKGYYLNSALINTKQANMLYSSSDMGATWSFVGEIPITKVNDLFFLNQDTGWAAGINGKIMKTTTGGLSWEEVPAYNADDIVRIRFFTENIGYYNTLKVYNNFPFSFLYRTQAGPWGVEDQKYPEPIRIVQNPVSSRLLLQTDIPDADIMSLDIITLTGNAVYHSTSFTHQIDLSFLAPGLYLLRYQYQGRYFIEKFIITKE